MASRKALGLIPQGRAPHTAGNQTDAFLSFLFLLGNAKLEQHREIVLILRGPICCTLLWFSFTAAEGILRRDDEEQLLIPHPYFFCSYKNLTLLRALRVFWRPKTVPATCFDTQHLRLQGRIKTAHGYLYPFFPVKWVERSRTDWSCLQHVLSLCWQSLLTVRSSNQALSQAFCLDCVRQHRCAKPP